jgi:hypothetical protein
VIAIDDAMKMHPMAIEHQSLANCIPYLPSLPEPRLEMQFVVLTEDEYDAHGAAWIYRMVYKHYTGEMKSLLLGSTYTTYKDPYKPYKGRWPNAKSSNRMTTPFRDGVHIMYDAWRFRLPAFVIFGDEVEWLEVQPEMAKKAMEARI